MRIITVRQPWEQAIVVGAKTVENRTAGIGMSYRGPLALHAGQGWSKRGARDPRILDLFPFTPRASEHELAGPERVAGFAVHPYFPMGEINAVCELVDIHPAAGCCAPWGEDAYVEAGGSLRTNIVHLVLEDVRALDWFIACRGALGLRKPTPELEAEILEATS
jgi:hypothetical protein